MQHFNEEIVFQSVSSGGVRAQDFVSVETTLKPLAAGEILVRLLSLSLDCSLALPDSPTESGGQRCGRRRLPGFGVGEVIESRDDRWVTGDRVFGEFGWARFAVVSGDEAMRLGRETAPEAQVSLLGRSGLAAWVATTRILGVTAADVFLVHAADRTVGAVAGQIARHRGARVIGIGYDPQRCRHAVEGLGFDNCVALEGHDGLDELREACGDGPTCYLEAVGGPTLAAVFPLLRPYARVALYGLLERAFDVGPPARVSARKIIAKRATVTGFMVQDFADLWEDWVHVAERGLREGWLRRFEDVSNGLETAPKQFERMMGRGSFGRPIITVA